MKSTLGNIYGITSSFVDINGRYEVLIAGITLVALDVVIAVRVFDYCCELLAYVFRQECNFTPNEACCSVKHFFC